MVTMSSASYLSPVSQASGKTVQTAVRASTQAFDGPTEWADGYNVLVFPTACMAFPTLELSSSSFSVSCLLPALP